MSSFILSLAIRLTILMVLGGLVALAMRRSTYAVRHVVVAATLACAIALPALMLAIPQWRVGVLPAAPPTATLFYSISAIPTASAPAANEADVTTSLRPVLVTAHAEGAMLEPSELASESFVAPSEPASASVSAPAPVPARFAPSASQIALGVWLLGMLAGLAWIALGRIGLARIRNRATPLASEEWRAILEAERANAGVDQNVALLESRAVTSPVTWGVLSPVIVLPSAAHSWAHDRKRVVVMHEMAHIARHDSATQLAATLASIVYWVHPLVILAARRLRAECERACDERVLELGTPATDYAAHLLDVAKYARSFGAASIVSVAMARPSQLEGRLMAVLRSEPHRGRSSAKSRVAASLFAATMLIAISAFMPVERDTSAVSTLRTPGGLSRVSELPNGRALANVSESWNRAQDTFPPATPATPATPAAPAAPATVSAPAAPLGPLASAAPVTTPAPAAPSLFATPLALLAPASPAAPATPATPAPFFSGAAIAAWSANAFRVHAKPDTTFVKSVPAKSGGNLDLDLDTGGDITITGTDEAKVTVSASLGGRSWRETTVSLEGSDNDVRLESRYEQRSGNQSFDNSFTIRVPKKFSVHVASAGGSVAISGVEGDFRGNTGGGPIVIDHAKGEARLSTGGGDIRISESNLDGFVTSGGGKVILNNVTGSVVSNSGSGRSYGKRYGYSYGMPDGNLQMEKYRVMVPDMKMDMAEMKMKDMTIDVPRVRFRMLDSAKMKKMMDVQGPEFEKARKEMLHAQEAMREAEERMARDRSTLDDDDSTMSDSATAQAREMFERHREEMASAREAMQRARESMLLNRDSDTSDSDPTIVTMKHMRMLKDGKSIVIDKDGGDVHLEDAPDGARIFTGGGAIVVERSKGVVRAQTGGGNIEISSAEGSAAAVTGAGDVSINLVGESAHPVNVSSGKGNIDLILPKDANATLDLETAYTKNYGKHTQIKGDWPLTVVETDEWDSSQGTPRKFVRVKQTIGKGGPVIRVRTVNGDIRIKRGS